MVWMADSGARAASELQVCVGRQIEPKMLVCAASRPKARQEGEGRMVACMRFSFLPSRPLLSPGACPVSLGRGRCKSKLHLFGTSTSVLRYRSISDTRELSRLPASSSATRSAPWFHDWPLLTSKLLCMLCNRKTQGLGRSRGGSARCANHRCTPPVSQIQAQASGVPGTEQMERWRGGLNIGLVFTCVARRDANMERWSSCKAGDGCDWPGLFSCMDGWIPCLRRPRNLDEKARVAG